MYRHHHGYWGGGWGGWGGGLWGGPFIRRAGFPLFGGWGTGWGGGGGLLGDLVAGGLGYMVGRQQGAQNQPYPPNQPYYQQPAPPYQQNPPSYQQGTPSYQAPPTQGGPQDSRLAQLRLLGQLRDSGVLTEDEFQVEKQKILSGF